MASLVKQPARELNLGLPPQGKLRREERQVLKLFFVRFAV